jgi:hypothetical protein
MIFRPQVWEARYFPSRDPGTGTLAAASLATSVIGTGMGIIGQSQAAQAQAAQAAGMAQYQASVARMNQALMEQNAQRAEQQGEADAERQDLKTAQLMGSQRAALAAQGGDVNAGSDLDILGDTARAGKLDELAIRSNAARQAYGFRVQGAGLGSQAGLYSAQAGNAYSPLSTLPFSIGSSLLGSASSLGDKWLTYSRKGGPFDRS